MVCGTTSLRLPALQNLIADLSTADADPLALSSALVGWANDQGGKDNISVALARLDCTLRQSKGRQAY